MGMANQWTIPWLGQVESVAERISIDPTEVGISKVKGLAVRKHQHHQKGGRYELA